MRLVAVCVCGWVGGGEGCESLCGHCDVADLIGFPLYPRLTAPVAHPFSPPWYEQLEGMQDGPVSASFPVGGGGGTVVFGCWWSAPKFLEGLEVTEVCSAREGLLAQLRSSSLAGVQLRCELGATRSPCE